jgi:hypothetical protein
MQVGGQEDSVGYASRRKEVVGRTAEGKKEDNCTIKTPTGSTGS